MAIKTDAPLPLLHLPPFLRAISAFCAHWDQKQTFNAGKLLGRIFYKIDRPHRRIVERNLAFAFPDWSANQIRFTALKMYMHITTTLLEGLQLASFSREKILENVHLTGKKHLLKASSSPRGVILFSAHLGSWEIGSIFASYYLGTPFTLVAQKIHNQRLNRWVLAMRSRFGNTLLDKRSALPGLSVALRNAKPVAMLVDQSTPRSKGVEIRFFNHTAMATPIVALLARRYRCPVLPAFCTRSDDGSLHLNIQAPLDLERTNDLKADLVNNTQRLMNIIEAAVRAHPEQWLWFHKRWKQHYPNLYT